jgi:transposase InsO family protein
MWAHLQRQGIPVARRTVERIMRRNGWRGVTRARRPPRTTEADPAAARAPDLVGRQWRVAAPNLLEVADFTYVPMTRGFGYTAFVVDAYAGLIPGWECSLVKDTGFVERALRHAVTFRTRQGHPFDNAIHHSDAGSQYTTIHYGEALMLEGLILSVGTVGDALEARRISLQHARVSAGGSAPSLRHFTGREVRSVDGSGIPPLHEEMVSVHRGPALRTQREWA